MYSINIIKIFIIIIFIIFIFIIHNIYYIYYKINIEDFNNNIIFLNKEELLNILLENNDKYYNTFYENDLYARKVKNIEEYKYLVKDSVSNFNKNQKEKIKKCIYYADIYFDKLFLEWFNGEKNNKIQWIIGCIKGKLYENGLPHTRNNIIIISEENINNFNQNKLIKTLIHEKVHIYQKKYPNDIQLYLNENNFIKIKKRELKDNIRANPDLDNWIYKDNQENIYKSVYYKNPSSIEDIRYYPIDNQIYEHPFEKMAIDIENNYYNKSIL